MSKSVPFMSVPSDAERCAAMRPVPDQSHRPNPLLERCRFRAVGGRMCALHEKLSKTKPIPQCQEVA